MKRPLIIFGIGKIAEVIAYYAMYECEFDIVAFCVDSKYKNTEKFLERPVVDFETVELEYDPNNYDFFVAVGYHDMNSLRQEKCEEARKKGFHLVSIVSANCHLPSNNTYGENCFIMPPAIIHPCVTIGNNVFIWSGALVGHHSTINDNCWITSNASLGGNVLLGQNTFIAMNATVGHNVSIGKECFLGSNTQVIKPMEDGQVVIAESSKPIKLNSRQFLKFSSFSSI